MFHISQRAAPQVEVEGLFAQAIDRIALGQAAGAKGARAAEAQSGAVVAQQAAGGVEEGQAAGRFLHGADEAGGADGDRLRVAVVEVKGDRRPLGLRVQRVGKEGRKVSRSRRGAGGGGSGRRPGPPGAGRRWRRPGRRSRVGSRADRVWQATMSPRGSRSAGAGAAAIDRVEPAAAAQIGRSVTAAREGRTRSVIIPAAQRMEQRVQIVRSREGADDLEQLAGDQPWDGIRALLPARTAWMVALICSMCSLVCAGKPTMYWLKRWKRAL